MAVNIAQASALSPLSAQNPLTLKEVWKGIQPNSCPHSYNFHMHTRASDGQLEPQAVMQQAVTIALKGMAITDHHTIRGYQQAKIWLENHQQTHPNTLLPQLWTGVEINANLCQTDVHILGYAFDPTHPAMQPYLQGKHAQGKDIQAGNVINALHQAGGLAVLAHPARYLKPAEQLIPMAARLGIDGVETYYAYGNPFPWTPSLKQTAQVKQLGDAYGLFNTCGTDTHGVNLLKRL